MAMSCLHVTVIPLSLLAFIFFVVALVSNHWVTISKCWVPQNPAMTSTLEYNQGLFQKCVSGECDNIMAGPPAALAVGGWCAGKGNNWFTKDQYCQGYAKCENGVTLEEGLCTGTQQFDLYTHKCASARPKCNCHDIRCKGKAPTAKKVVSNHLCSGWYQCSTNPKTNVMDYSSGSCSSTQWFDTTATPQICVGTQPGACADKECVDGSGNRIAKSVVVTDKPTCENYYKCTNGKKSAAVTCSNTQSARLDYVGNSVQTQCTNANFQRMADESICQSPICKVNAASKITDPTKKDCRTYHSCSAKMIQRGKTCPGTSSATGLSYFDDVTANACVAHANKIGSCQAYECIGQPDRYTVTDGSTCTKFTRCSAGGLTYTASGACPGSDTIETGSLACSNSQKNSCKNPKCLNKAAGSYLNPDDKKCKTYFRCGAGETLLTAETTCPGTGVFVKTKNSCQSTTASGSTTCYDPRCTALDGTWLKTRGQAGMSGLKDTTADGRGRKNCQKYWECNLGFRTEKDCGANSYYDVTTALCTLTRPTNCEDERCKSLADGKHGTVNDNNCLTYKVCASELQTTTGTCQMGGGVQMLIDAATRDCVDPSLGLPSACKGNGCKSLADGKHGTDGADCLTYKVCKNQWQTSTGTCQMGGGVQWLIDAATRDCVDPSAGLPSACKVRVDGGWSPWSLYSACNLNTTYNAKADAGTAFRSRACDCPSKQGTGADCKGVSFEASLCYNCSPEKGWLMGARAGLALAMACSIMTLLWAIWCCYSMKCYASHAVIFHTFVSVIGGLVGAIMANGNMPDLGYICEVKSGWGFIMAILGVLLSIVTFIIAIVISVKGRNRVQSADGTKMQERNKKPTTEETNPTYNE